MSHEVVINNINIYHIHDNSYHIDNRNSSGGNVFKPPVPKPDEADFGDIITHIVLNGDEDNPLIKELENRLIESEGELKDLIDKLNNENQ